ncbi:MAG: hypothetical protein KTR25_06380 [Myxococcales bacterium]|nr:hypothetical protein [Myxococcales bacterium]
MLDTATNVEILLQAEIESLYRVEGVPNIAPFQVDEAFLARFRSCVKNERETLLIHQHGDDVDLAIFLSEKVRADAASCLAGMVRGRVDDLDAFCAALEGVSHFVYVIFSGHHRPVSLLELELQAEIDKFFVLGRLVGFYSEELIPQLFDNFQLRDRMTVSLQERYIVANRAARRYARWTQRRFRSGRGHDALADARKLYRMPMASKLERIEQAV